MEFDQIEKLIHKYIEAQTSIEEENKLKKYLLSKNVPIHLKKYQALFQYFQETKNQTFTKEITLKIKRKNLKWLSIVASIILLIVVYTGYRYKYYQQKQTQIQYTQVKQVLEVLSENLKKRNTALSSLYTYQNTVNKLFKSK